MVRPSPTSIAVLAALFVVALFANHEGSGVPVNNEWVYAPLMARTWDPARFAGDWILEGSLLVHRPFNLTFGWITLLLPLDVVCWIGRSLCLLALLGALLALGRSSGLSAGAAGAAIGLWLVAGQSFVAWSWIVGTFEAQSVGYACVLWAMSCFVRSRDRLGAALVGVAFTAHAVVGLWGGIACAVGLLALRPAARDLVVPALLAAVCAIPGIVSARAFLEHESGRPPEAARLLVENVFAMHLDATRFGLRWDVALFGMLAFNLAVGRRVARQRAGRFFAGFQLAAAVAFALGLAAAALGSYEFLLRYPFRLAAVSVPLFFCFNLAGLLSGTGLAVRRARLAAAVAALVAVPVFGVPQRVGDRWRRWTAPDDDVRVALRWIDANTRPDAVLIAPPDRKDSRYYANRGVVVAWDFPRYDDIPGWRARLEALTGDIRAGGMRYLLPGRYERLSQAEVMAFRDRFGGDVMLTRADYTFPALFRAGELRVYDLATP